MKKLILLFSIVASFGSHIHAQTWTELGSGSAALNANYDILSICTDPAGNVYATGLFTDGAISSTGNEYVAKWNGVSWSKLQTGFVLDSTSYIYSNLTSLCSDPAANIYVAGVSVGGHLQVAKWNGTTWSGLGTGANALNANGDIHSICADASGNIYAGGLFTDGSGNYYVAKWNGSSWTELGAGFNDAVNSICADPSGNIYASGFFTDASGDFYVAKWNGSSWSSIGHGFGGTMYRVCSDPSGNIYAGGVIGAVAKWDGSSWAVMGSAFNQSIYAITSDPTGNIYTGGNFTNGTSYFDGDSYVAKWHGSYWSELGTGTHALKANSLITSIQSDVHGNIYAAGYFTNALGYTYVAKYDAPSGVSYSEKSSDAQLLVYPNPTNGAFIIEISEPATTATYILTDVSGKCFDRKENTSLENGKIKVDLTTVPAGTYFIQVITATAVYREKVEVR